MMEAGLRRKLFDLARLYDIQLGYRNASGKQVTPSPDGIVGALKVLGAAVEGLADVPNAIRARRDELARRCLPPVHVVWEGRPPGAVPLRLSGRVPRRLQATFELEDGETKTWRWCPQELPPLKSHKASNSVLPAGAVAAPLPSGLKTGYHRLHVGGRDISGDCTLIVAPRKAFQAGVSQERGWGVFLPLYALMTRRTSGLADFSDLGILLTWARAAGCDAVATLPMLPAFLDEPFEPSPYAPVSRLFWNELYVDPRATEEFDRCAQARARLEGKRTELLRLAEDRLVDYRAAWSLKRPVLSALAEYSFESEASRIRNEQFAKQNPEAARYAAFRAACERQRRGWQAWTERMRGGEIRRSDYRAADEQLYLYTQRVAAEQVRQAGGAGAGLYLDLPVGVHSDGFDAWRNQHLFALTASAGAPPDIFFSKGQNWGFAPLIPAALRLDGYRYLRSVFRHHMAAARMLRVDHVMGFHRMFIIPSGAEARDGVYVRYRADEIYAVLAIESQRHGTVVVGEDLGTVPAYVGPAMRRHNVKRMYCAYFRVRPLDRDPLPVPAPDAVSFLNTHDMPTFSAWWTGADTRQRQKLGIVSAAQAREERAEKARIKSAVSAYFARKGYLDQKNAEGSLGALRAFLRFLAESPSAFVLVNMEDLWLEPSPQNVPGTTAQHPNWRQRAAHPLEEWSSLPGVIEALAEMNRLRHRQDGGG
ncbi:MAG: 4-alpha-glucanotransferase [Chloroflexi bacterium]|nr:4-alpha-glucanotransferase [Chloroflexota bacterium]